VTKFRVGCMIFDTAKAVKKWKEASDWDGHNYVSRPTGSPWIHETLYLSQKGRYYVERSSDYEGTQDEIEVLQPKEAAVWLLLNDHDDDLPENLAGLAYEVVE